MALFQDKMSWCYFPGHAVFKVARAVVTTEADVRAFVHKVTEQQAWLTDYSVRRNYSTPFRIDEGLEELPQHLNAVVGLIRSAQVALSEVFDK